MSKKLLFILGIPALLLLTGYIYLHFSLRSSVQKEERKTGAALPASTGPTSSIVDLRPLFIKRLQLLVRSSSNGLYDLLIDSMTADVFASTVSFHDIAIQPNRQQLEALKANHHLPENVYYISFQCIIIEGINLQDVLTSQTMNYKLVRMVKPVIRIDHHKSTQKKEQEPFSQRFLKQMQELSIKKLVIEGGTIITGSKKKHLTNRLEDVWVTMTDMLLNHATRNDKQRFLFAKSASIEFHHYQTPIDKGLYQLKIGTVIIKEPQRLVSLKGVSLATPLSRTQFEKQQTFRKELFRLSLPLITIRRVNWWNFFNGAALRASIVSLPGGKLTDYLDRSLPPSSRMGRFPNQLLMALPLKMHIDRLSIRKLDFVYTEFNPVSKQSGTINFDKIDLDARNLTNLKRKNEKPFTVNGSCLLMDQIPLHAVLRFSLSNYTTGAFTAIIRSDKELDATLFNRFVIPLGMTKIEKGRLQQLHACMEGNQWQASGQVLIQYKNLKLGLLEKDRGRKSLDKKRIKSFIANTFFIKDNNPQQGLKPQKVEARFKRDPDAGYFMLVWKTILAGALKTMGAPAKSAYKKAETGQ